MYREIPYLRKVFRTFHHIQTILRSAEECFNKWTPAITSPIRKRMHRKPSQAHAGAQCRDRVACRPVSYCSALESYSYFLRASEWLHRLAANRWAKWCFARANYSSATMPLQYVQVPHSTTNGRLRYLNQNLPFAWCYLLIGEIRGRGQVAAALVMGGRGGGYAGGRGEGSRG